MSEIIEGELVEAPSEPTVFQNLKQKLESDYADLQKLDAITIAAELVERARTTLADRAQFDPKNPSIKALDKTLGYLAAFAD